MGALTSSEDFAQATESFSRVSYEGGYLGHHLRVGISHFSTPEGHRYTREALEVGEVVVICAYDEFGLWIVRQPREAVGEGALLELAAGGVDQRDAGPGEAARRELSEELGLGAHSWQHLRTFYASPGISDERMHLYAATDLYEDSSGERDANERLTTERIPLSELPRLITECRDAKSIIGMCELQALLGR